MKEYLYLKDLALSDKHMMNDEPSRISDYKVRL